MGSQRVIFRFLTLFHRAYFWENGSRELVSCSQMAKSIKYFRRQKWNFIWLGQTYEGKYYPAEMMGNHVMHLQKETTSWYFFNPPRLPWKMYNIMKHCFWNDRGPSFITFEIAALSLSISGSTTKVSGSLFPLTTLNLCNSTSNHNGLTPS